MPKLHVVTAPGQLYFGHMTVYPGAHKERLHGHNFTIFVDLELRDGSMAAMIDLGVARRALDALCDAWRERTLLAAHNPHFVIIRDDDELEFTLCGARYVLPRGDVLLLPIENTSVEGLAEHVAGILATQLTDPNIRALDVRIEELVGIGASYRLETPAR